MDSEYLADPHCQYITRLSVSFEGANVHSPTRPKQWQDPAICRLVPGRPSAPNSYVVGEAPAGLPAIGPPSEFVLDGTVLWPDGLAPQMAKLLLLSNDVYRWAAKYLSVDLFPELKRQFEQA